MILFAHHFRRPVFECGTVTLILMCSACATVSQTARTKPPEKGPIQAIYQEPSSTENSQSKTARKSRESTIQQLVFEQPAEGVTRVHRDPEIQQMSSTEETGVSASGVQLLGVIQPDEPATPMVQQTQWVSRAQTPIEGCPPEPRWPAAGPNPMAPGMMANDVVNVPSPEKYTDEYLCDGGDRDWPVHYDQFARRGLDTEDTVLEYTDRQGFEKMKPSNRVCVYSPRFASVRTVSRPYEGLGTSEVAGVGQLATTSGMHSRTKASNNVKREMSGRIAVRSRASGMEKEEVQGSVSQLRSASTHDKLLNIYQALTFVRSGRIDDADSARLNYGLQAALSWTREQYPVITSKTDMALEGHFEQSSATITGIDDESEKPENLRIVKLADKKSAVPGDEIEFTIRYDNLGGREAHHIRIVDNLTPRLQYVDDSATSDRDGRLVLQDNGEGSQVLIWELDAPLKGKTGGIVTFKARVR